MRRRGRPLRWEIIDPCFSLTAQQITAKIDLHAQQGTKVACCGLMSMLHLFCPGHRPPCAPWRLGCVQRTEGGKLALTLLSRLNK